jgi:hypothetical protein
LASRLACSLPLPRRASPICGGSRSLLGKGLAPILLVVAHIFTGASLLYNSGTRISCAPLLANYNGALGLDVRHSYSWGGGKFYQPLLVAHNHYAKKAYQWRECFRLYWRSRRATRVCIHW